MLIEKKNAKIVRKRKKIGINPKSFYIIVVLYIRRIIKQNKKSTKHSFLLDRKFNLPKSF